MTDTGKLSLTRRAALQAAIVVAACGVANADAPPTGAPHPKDRECIWIPTPGGKFLCGMVHRPVDKKGKFPAVLIIHGVLASKDQPHRMFVALAEALSAAGYVALRFDLQGRGDSEGKSVDATPARDLDDARSALAAIPAINDADVKDITVLGMGWGGMLASYLAGESTTVKRVVLWASCPLDNEAWKSMLKDIEGRMASDQNGNLLGKEFYEGLPDLTPLTMLKKRQPPVLMVYGTHDEYTRQVNYETCKSELSFGNVDVKTATIEGANHEFTNHEAERQAIQKTIDWLNHQP